MALKGGLFALVMLSIPVIAGAVIATAVAGMSGAERGRVIAVSIGVAIVLLIAVTLGLMRMFRPVRDLVRAAGTLADGDYRARVGESGPVSIRPALRSFNSMATRLEDADEQRRRLLADIGHELRTPLTVVRGEIEAIVDGVHELSGERLEPLLDDVAVMERLLDDLRTLSDVEAGVLHLHREPTDVSLVVADVATSQAAAARALGVELIEQVSPVPLIEVDPIRIREVISNLVVNALKAMPRGGRLTLASTLDGESVVVAVADTGIGMEPAEVSAAFDRFHKGSGSTGSGLGLHISKNLVEAHGGNIEIDSAAGEGTTVTVRIPAELS